MNDENIDDLNQLPIGQRLNALKKAKRSRSAPQFTKFKFAVEPPAVEQLQSSKQVVYIHPRPGRQSTRKDTRAGRSRSRARTADTTDCAFEFDTGAGTGADFRYKPPPAPRTTDEERWERLRPALFEQSLRHEHVLQRSVVARAQQLVAPQEPLAFTPCRSCQQQTQRVLRITDEASFIAPVKYYTCTAPYAPCLPCISAHARPGFKSVRLAFVSPCPLGPICVVQLRFAT